MELGRKPGMELDEKLSMERVMVPAIACYEAC